MNQKEMNPLASLMFMNNNSLLSQCFKGLPTQPQPNLNTLFPNNISNILNMMAQPSIQSSPVKAVKEEKEATSPIVTQVGKSKKVLHSCPHCNFSTVMSQHMKSHLEAHDKHQGQMYQCDICHMQFSQKANMHRHRMRHSGQKPYECKYCKKKFFRKDQVS